MEVPQYLFSCTLVSCQCCLLTGVHGRHILLPKASHEARPDSRARETDAKERGGATFIICHTLHAARPLHGLSALGIAESTG